MSRRYGLQENTEIHIAASRLRANAAPREPRFRRGDVFRAQGARRRLRAGGREAPGCGPRGAGAGPGCGAARGRGCVRPQHPLEASGGPGLAEEGRGALQSSSRASAGRFFRNKRVCLHKQPSTAALGRACGDACLPFRSSSLPHLISAKMGLFHTNKAIAMLKINPIYSTYFMFLRLHSFVFDFINHPSI